MEVSVSFTDGNTDFNEHGFGNYTGAYIIDETAVGRAWIPEEGLILEPPLRVRYEKYPWIDKFELDGVRAAPARRKGIGTKGTKGFVRSLSTIYSAAYDDYREFGGDEAFDSERYFRNAAQYFTRLAEDADKAKIVSKFCGFVENMWREGDREMLDVCMRSVVPVLRENAHANELFEHHITEEFMDYLKGRENNGTQQK